jgi:2-dehydro-3-deoxyphosphogluconate aldolase / (4S)-4-hydroxy-2-oxoglutarate aldolase
MNWIEREKVIAVVRLDNLEGAVALTEALVEGGVTTVEFTYTNRHAGQAIEAVRDAMGHRCLVGAGTVLDAETARSAILAGAQFLVTPTFNPRTIEVARRYGITTVIGAFTATEMLNASEAGADYIKVHPASLGGPQYFRDILAPLPHLKLVPSGGVTLDTAPEFMRAGAVAVAAGGNLVGRGSMGEDDLLAVTERARAFRASVET